MSPFLTARRKITLFVSSLHKATQKSQGVGKPNLIIPAYIDYTQQRDYNVRNQGRNTLHAE
jgi:hypothetical protein